MQGNSGKIKYFVTACIILCLLVFVADLIRRQQHNQKVEWKRNLFADGAGYYSYLPWLFIYEAQADNFPPNIEKQTGQGFQVRDHQLKVKYTCGVAIMQSPVFLAVHFIEKIRGNAANGFDAAYQLVPLLSALIYLVAGMFFLFRFMRNYSSAFAAGWALFVIFWGTNLSYYVSEYPAMSHVYSFALFSAFLYFADLYCRNIQWKHFVILSFLAAMIVLIRPTNVVFLLLFLCVPTLSGNPAKWKEMISLKKIFISLIVGILVFLPQMIFWKINTGHFIYDSYEKEGFSNLFSPAISLFLFSPDNGLFPYVPIWFMLLFAAFYGVYRKNYYSMGALFCLGVVVYLGSSWFDWRFGCSFGSRTTMEYLAVFALPLAGLTDVVMRQKKYLRVLFVAVTILFMAIPTLLSRKFEHCFMGRDDQDWRYYGYLLRPWSHEKSSETLQSELATHEYSASVEIHRSEMDQFSYYFRVSAEAQTVFHDSEAEMFLAIVTAGGSHPIHHLVSIGAGEHLTKETLLLPPDAGDWENCKVFIWNKGKVPLQVKKLSVCVE